MLSSLLFLLFELLIFLMDFYKMLKFTGWWIEAYILPVGSVAVLVFRLALRIMVCIPQYIVAHILTLNGNLLSLCETN